MAYLPNNLSQLAGTIEGSFKFWQYSSPDLIATVQGAGYVNNAANLGMQVNDIVIVIDTTTPARYFAAVTAISGAGAATLGQKLTFA
jgi:hypothetical protein